MIVVEFEKDIYIWCGVMLGVYMDEFEYLDKGGFVLEGGGVGFMEIGMFMELGIGKSYLEFMFNVKNYVFCISFIYDYIVG